jgi:eukaryotic-like serine/threonine-protein kinase
MIDLSGQTVGNYRIESLLGTGGMGQVYRGVHNLLNRPAAIKVMHPHLAADPDFQARFLHEAQAIAALSHPSIIEIYEFGQEDERFYLVMELVTDGSLRNFLQRRDEPESDWSLSAGLDFVRQAAEGLAYAHTKGMIHRDVKPDNLLLKQVEVAGNGPAAQTIKVTDFGLARVAEGGNMTLTGVIMGSPAYMSPEQSQGTVLDGRSDQYSLGVVLYEVVTGYLPFEAKSISEAVYKHIYTAPPPPRQIVPDISADLEDIILRSLAKDPADRYPTAAEMATALARVRANTNLETMVRIVPPQQSREVPPLTTRVASADTAVQPPLGRTIPPAASTIIGATTAPRVHVVDHEGHRLQTVDLTSRGLSIGRTPDNDVILTHEAISRHHLRVDWNGDAAVVTDRGSINGTLLDGTRLPPNVGQAWAPADWLQAGPFWLRLDTPPPLERSTAIFDAAEVLSGADISSQDSKDASRIRVVPEQTQLRITAGQPAVAKVTLANVGRTVDHFGVFVEGVPDTWVHGPEREVQLNPGTQAAVALTVSPPRTSDSRAGDYQVTVRARSRENPDESGVAECLWTVLPFAAGALALAPRRASGWRRAQYVATVENRGNATASYGLTGKDEEQNLRYTFLPEAAALDPGASIRIPLVVQGRWRIIGSRQRRTFEVEAAPSGEGQAQTVSGEFAHRAILPSWLPPLLLIALAILLFIIRALLPDATVKTFSAEPSRVAPRTPVTLRWDVANSGNVTVKSANGTFLIDPDIQGSATDTPSQNTTYILSAPGRWGKPSATGVTTVVVATLTPTPTATPRPTATSRPVHRRVPAIIPAVPPSPTPPPPPPTSTPRAKTNGNPKSGKARSIPATPRPTPKPAAAAPKPAPTATHRPRPTATLRPTARAKPTHTALPPPTATPRPQSTVVSFKSFLGTWGNRVPATQEGDNTLTQLVIRQVDSRGVRVQAYYKCGTNECDWGTTTLHYSSQTPPTLSGQFQVANGSVLLVLQRSQNLMYAHVSRCDSSGGCVGDKSYLYRLGQ